MVQKTISPAEAKALVQEQETLKKRAARQAAKELANPQEIPEVECVVLPMGDGKISMGTHIAGVGEAHYEEGEKFTVKVPIAVELFDRGFVNFPGAREASAEHRAARAAAARAAREASARAREAAEAEVY